MSSYLTELCRFHERMLRDPDSDMPREGLSSELISFALILDDAGNLVGVDDLRNSKGRPARMSVPAAVVRSSNKTPNFLWDNSGYILCVDDKKPDADNRLKHERFKAFHEKMLFGVDDREAVALLAFLSRWTPDQIESPKLRDFREDIQTGNIVFRMEGSDAYFHQSPALMDIWMRPFTSGSDEIFGDAHPKIKGVTGAQPTGASLISVNIPSFRSYGKEDNTSSPLTKAQAKAYTTALNYLLQYDHGQVMRVGDTSMVFWAEKAHPLEKEMNRLFDIPLPADKEESPQDGDRVALLRDVLSAIRNGEPVSNYTEEGTRFFVLGLAPNIGRISVRYWLCSTLKELLRHAARWYDDLSMERPSDKLPEYPSLRWLLVNAVAQGGKAENIPPELAGQLAKCALLGSRFPESVYIAILQRIRADKKVDYCRVALIKAFFCRNRNMKEDGMRSLDKEETNIGYRLGRAFALLEKAQKDANGGGQKPKGKNAPDTGSIASRYLGAASTTPGAVFPTLLRLSKHHVTKLVSSGKEWYETWYNRQMEDILEGMTAFPAVLSLDDQGRFFLGYFNQQRDFYRKKDDGGAETPDGEIAEMAE